MNVAELIERLRRFSQGSFVTWDGVMQILEQGHFYEVDCPDHELPQNLQDALEK